MRSSLIVKLTGFLLLYSLSINSAFSKNIDNLSLINQLENILNQKEYDSLKDIFLEKSLKKFEKSYKVFTKAYKNTKWSIKLSSNHQSESYLDIKITSTREIGDHIYDLNSKQIVKVETFENKIKSYNVINEESTLSSKKSPLVIKIISPNKVLTGEKYEMNLIIEKPLDNSITASGMIVLKNQKNSKISNHNFFIKPNQSGGLFKYIQAPLEPGSQTISAIITHPEGIYSMTKKIKIGL